MIKKIELKLVNFAKSNCAKYNYFFPIDILVKELNIQESEVIDSEFYINDTEEPLSACCHAPIIHSDICSDCKEHTTACVTCQKCKGRGEYLGESGEMTGCDCENGYIYLEDL